MRKTKILLLAGTVLPTFALGWPAYAEAPRVEAPIVLAQQDGEPGSRREQRQQERAQQREERQQDRAQQREDRGGGGGDRAQQREERTQQREERQQERAQPREERQKDRAEPREDRGGADRAKQREERAQQREERQKDRAEPREDRGGDDDRAKQREERAQQRDERQKDRADPREDRGGGGDRAQQREERTQQREERQKDRADQRDDRQDRGGANGDRGSLRDRMEKDRQDRAGGGDAKDRRDDAKDKREDAKDRQDAKDRRDDRQDKREDVRDRRDDKREEARIDRLKDERRERRDGDRVFITEPGGRTIIREGGKTIIRRDENARFRLGARDVREERRNGEIRTVVTRPDGSRIITITDEDGRLLRRIREDGGREYVLIDNRPRGGGRGFFVDLDIAPPRISIPRERYIVDADTASADDIYDAFDSEPVARPERSYSLDEIRQSAPLRSYVRSVDLDSINFDFGSWEVRDDQIKKLETVGNGMERAIKKNPQTVFMIEGHTDAVGAADDNLSLSDRRAESVAEILTKYFDVPAENLTTQGYGEQYLKVDTQEPEERNRRVTVRNITPLLSSKN